MKKTTPLETALFYNGHGLPVFPCRECAEEIIDRKTGEIITLGEKTPRLGNGFLGASKYKRIIERWWKDWPNSVVGLPTGAASGVMVLDIDNKPGGANGFDWLAEMVALHGDLPETAQVTTPNGGLHIYFRYVDGTRNRGALGGGVDIRSEGGYVVTAGSVMADGRAYEWVTPPADGELPAIADAPDWLLELLLPKAKPEGAPKEYNPSGVGNTAYVQTAINNELAELAATPQGGRNNAINDAAFALGQFVGAGVLSYAEAERELQAIASQWGNFAKSCGTIRNGLNAGMRSPRDIPEPQWDDSNTRLVDISRMIENGLKKARAATLTERYEAASEPAKDTEREHFDAEDTETEQITPNGTPEKPPVLVATPFNWIDPRTLPRREFAYGNHLIRKYVSVTVSPGGLGKTSLGIAECLAMASGKALLGVKPPQRLRVWNFNSEDPRDEMERRFMAAAIHYKLKPEDFNGYLFLDTGREQELVVAVEDKRAGLKYIEPVIEAIIEQIVENKIDVMIVDPFVSTHGVNENDNGQIDKVAKLWAHIADHTNCAIDIVHHLRKVADREATVEDARGAVSLIGAARSVRVLNRMSEDQATQAGVAIEDRFGHFSVTYGKSNLTPLNSKLDWRKLESVPLGNDRGLDKPQDYAPVVTAWEWPTKEALAESVDASKAELVRVRVRNGDYTENWQAASWVGVVVADIMGIELPPGREKTIEHKRVERLIEGWLETGMLRKERVKGVDVRHPDRWTTYIRVGG